MIASGVAAHPDAQNAAYLSWFRASLGAPPSILAIGALSTRRPACRISLPTINSMELPLADKSLDARHLNCPLPILKATKALKEVAVGGTLEVLATDPGSAGDFEAFCRVGRHEMLEESHTDGVFRFLIRRGR